MFGYLVFATVCGLAYGHQVVYNKLYEANQDLVETVRVIKDNLVYDGSEYNNTVKTSFTQLLSFNEYFVTDNTYPNKEKLFAYLDTYKSAKDFLLLTLKQNPHNVPVTRIVDSTEAYYGAIKSRVDQLNNVCGTVKDEETCTNMLSEFDAKQEQKCPGYTNKNAKLHKLSLKFAKVILNLTNEYLKLAHIVYGFTIERYLETKKLQNAAGLVALAKEYNFFTLNDFTC